MKKKRNKARVFFSEVASRAIEYVKSDDIYINGDDNLYAETVQNILYQSPTASLAIRALGDFIAGDGVENDFIVNKKGQYISELIEDIANDIAIQNGFYLKVDYKIDEVNDELKYIPVNPILIPYTNCRIGKVDDSDNEGKIYVGNWDNESNSIFSNIFKRNKNKWYYPFNNNQKIISDQIKNDGGIEKYRGQIMYVNLTPKFKYALSLFNAVLNDADSEYRIGAYVNTQWKDGFLGKTIVISNGLDEDFEDVIEQWIGVKGGRGIAYVALEQTTDVKDALHIQQIPSQYDEKQHSETKESVRENILGAAKNLPKQLVFDSNGLFSQSGEAIRELKQFYWEQTKKERRAIEKSFSKIGIDVEIKSIIE